MQPSELEPVICVTHHPTRDKINGVLCVFIVCVVLCTLLCLSVVCYCVCCVLFVLCLIVVPLPQGNPNFNNNNNNAPLFFSLKNLVATNWKPVCMNGTECTVCRAAMFGMWSHTVGSDISAAWGRQWFTLKALFLNASACHHTELLTILWDLNISRLMPIRMYPNGALLQPKLMLVTCYLTIRERGGRCSLNTTCFVSMDVGFEARPGRQLSWQIFGLDSFRLTSGCYFD
jgi:hypothetical protein